MNRETTDRKTRRKNTGRRIMASVCAIAIALLQCAVILTIDTENVHAADGDVKLELTYKNDKNTKVTRTINVKDLTDDKKTCEIGEGDNVIKLSGPSLSAIFRKAGANNVTGVDNDDFIITEARDKDNNLIDGYENLYKKCNVNDKTPVDYERISGETTDHAIKSFSKSASPTKVKVGETSKITYSLTIDEFFQKSSEYGSLEDDLLKIKWTARNAKINGGASIITTNKNGSFDVIVTAKGAATIKPESVNGYAIDTREVSVTGETTPAPPTPPSSTKKSLKGATVKLKNGNKIYKNTQYSTSEIKNKITVTDKKGNKVDPENYEIVKVSFDGNNVKITIKGVNEYKDSTSGSVKYSNSSGSNSQASRHKPNTYGTFSRSPVTGSTSSTGTTVPNVTYAPDRTITVKEVFLGQEIAQEPEPAPTPADMMNDAAEDMMENSNSDWAEDQSIDLDFGPMAGSAAVAVAACGAGAVGRVRRFKVDTAAEVVKQITNSKGK